MKKALVLGAGFAGCTITYLLQQAGWEVTVFEKDEAPGGGARTFFYGGHPYTNGPRIFHCPRSRPDIYNFMDDLVKLREIPHHLMTYIEQDKQHYSYPIHEEDIEKMPDRDEIKRQLGDLDRTKTPVDFEDFWCSNVGEILYNKYVKEYSKKMWMIDDNKEITDFSKTLKGEAIKKGSKNVVLFDWINAYPIDFTGYNAYFDCCLENAHCFFGCEVTGFRLEKGQIEAGGEWHQGDIIISTISPDALSGYAFGKLPYMGRDFVRIVLPVPHVLPGDVQFMFNPNKGDFLRCVEYKQLTGYEAESTLLVLEMPSRNNQLYPYPMEAYHQLAEKYLAALPDNVHPLGRLGRYKYTNFWEIISDSFELIKKLS